MATRSPFALSILAAILAVGPLAAGGAGDTKAERIQAARASEGVEDRTEPGSGLRLARKHPAMPGELLVQFRIGATAQTKAEAMLPIRGRSLEAIRLADNRLASMAAGVPLANVRGDLERVSIPEGLSFDEAIRVLKTHPDVEFAQPNWIYQALATPNDPRYGAGNLWGLYGPATSPSNAYGLNALAAWNAGFIGSRNVYIAVIDEGVQFNHPDLADNVWTNPFETAGDGIDNDGNGFIDDVHGYDFGNNDATVYDGPASGSTSTDQHGTHVAGTIGATGNNGVGSVGVCWQVSIISCKFLLANGGTGADMIRAIDYVIDLKTRHGLDIVATNNSYGGDPFAQAELDAISRLAQANILYCAAAGNDSANNDTSPHYPSNYDTTAQAGWNNIIAVASITSTGGLSSFSDYGATTVHLGAPGSSISSTSPANTYATLSGTSMATPHVTGAAALIAAATGKRGNALRQAILDNVKPLASLNGRTTTGGRLDLSFLGATASAPIITSQPANAAVNAGATATFTVAVSGTAPFTYQWRKNAVNISGATAASYTTPATTSSDNGATFSVVVTNSVGSATSTNATLTVNAATAPVITTQPASKSVTAGATATFTVGASGTAPFTYQWRKNGAAIAGATAASYTTPATTLADSGATFSAVVSNSVGSATSGNATLTVTSAPPSTTFTEIEPNNTIAAANAVAASYTAIKGNHAATGNPDFFALTLLAGQKLSINMTGPTGVDWDLALKNSAGTNLASSTGGTATESLSYTNTGAAAMTVYTNVYVYSGTSATPYNLALGYVTPPPSVTFNEAEANNSIAAANAVPDNATKVVGYIGSTTDNDYFAVNVGASKTLNVKMTGPTGTTYDYDLYFYNAAGTQLASGTGSTTTENVSWTNGASATTVYVAVKRYKGSSTTTPYNLAITR
ncbi:MAG: S8 family serine peptidase [Holophagaceae bacterium]|nr:S8 family serine peptidase [Holophagaceae bacterium]